jgi:hypothetical protein
MNTKSLERRLADLWLSSVHCSAAVADLAWDKKPTESLRAALRTVCEVPGVEARLHLRVSARRDELMAKGYELPDASGLLVLVLAEGGAK